MSPREAVVAFFENLGAPRVSISRETLSRLLKIAYPTLDPVLDALAADGVLERATCLDQWRPTRSFTSKIAGIDKAERARRLVTDIEQREAAREAAEERLNESIAQANAKRAARIAEAAARKAAREERRRAAEAHRKARAEAFAKSLAEVTAAREKKATEKREKMRGQKSADAVVSASQFQIVVPAPPEPPAPPPDPWAKIRERHYSRPPLVASCLRQLSKEELMTGRPRKTA